MIYAILANTLVVAMAVLVHYEFLYRSTAFLPKLPIRHRYRIVVGTFGLLIAHSIEIWIFASAYYLMNQTDGWGTLTGNFDGSLMDCVYYSFTVYTTLGFGDISPLGRIRYLTGLESLTGLLLITWTASFLYLEMRRHWNYDVDMD
jgi:hypothetical protein